MQYIAKILSISVLNSGGSANLQEQRSIELEWGQSAIISPTTGYDGMKTVSVSTKKPTGSAFVKYTNTSSTSTSVIFDNIFYDFNPDTIWAWSFYRAKGSPMTPRNTYTQSDIGRFFATDKGSYISQMVVNYNNKQPTVYFNFEDKSVLLGNASIVVYDHKIEIIFHDGKVTTTNLDTLNWDTAFISPYTLEFRYYVFN